MTTPTLSTRPRHMTRSNTAPDPTPAAAPSLDGGAGHDAGVGPDSVTGFMQAFGVAQMRAETLMKIVAADHGIGVSDLRALYFVHGGTDVTPRELAAYLDLSSGSVTSLVDRMTDAGFLDRAAHPSDRRSSVLVIAPDGVALIEGEIGYYLEVFDGLASRPELAVVTTALAELATSMTRHAAARSAGTSSASA
ncbi:DNA-binding MarR family transcriptional regulator [Frigoribacterium sp. PhB107]|uniref:MarR family winged helix-turn-helix transcriptional regulator n=1 Tax=Frigoribacterium sp. PhB107 TaxID=2485172 RepID=UPI000F96C988|nr:MarR family transcriptional regulator [Frigoribacterium sp. PhB107]ROP72978.1 DNA-binding MarR family transcriptional regulator [Frigoribacterium sp. PhB107]